MCMRYLFLYGSLAILLFGAGAYFVFVSEPRSRETDASNFDACERAGYFVIDTFPRQCQTPEGYTYFEESIPETAPFVPATPDTSRIVPDGELQRDDAGQGSDDPSDTDRNENDLSEE
jgi:hypothetical protein